MFSVQCHEYHTVLLLCDDIKFVNLSKYVNSFVFRRKKEKYQKTTGEGHERSKGKGKDSDKDADTDHEEPIKQPSEAELKLIQRYGKL